MLAAVGLAAVGFAALAGACDVDGPRPEAEPAPTLVAALATPADPALGPSPIAADGSSVVSAATSITLRFDRFLDPRTVLRQAVCLRASDQIAAQPQDCTDGVTLRPRYDPVSRAAIYHLDAPLLPDTVYRLDVYAATEPGDFGFRAHGGAPLASPAGFVMRSASYDPAAPPAPEAPPRADAALCQRVGLLLKTCGDCHDTPTPQNGFFPPAGLTLKGVADLDALSAAGRVAAGTQTGGDADTPAARPERFGARMPIVALGDAGQSYLLYKIMIGNPAATLDPALPVEEQEALRARYLITEEEIARLRELTTGMPMPPTRTDLSTGQVEVLLPPAMGSIQDLADVIAAGGCASP